MPSGAKFYIGLITTAGLVVLGIAVFQDAFPHPKRFLAFTLLGVLASTLKVRLPGLAGNISVSFLFILIAIADFSFTQTVILACCAALVQSLWRTSRRPRPEQVVFNLSTLALSAAVAYWGSHLVLASENSKSLPVLLGLAASLYFVSNTGLFVGVISLAERRPFKETWRNCNSWTFPYYLVGAAFAGLVSVLSRSVGWKSPLLVLAMMYLTYLWYRQYVEKAAARQASTETEVVLSSRNA